ncbi:MAG TPA: HEPN domain-containing protein [Methanoregulaceae archaeon]|nr:HEPN domain-containing protein [Methanoregulaceae archaeon]
MSHRFDRGIESRGLRRSPVDPARVDREIAEARADLSAAKRTLDQADYKWAIVKAYYAIFHACRSLVYSAGYSEKSHDCVIVAVQDLFVAPGTLPAFVATAMREAKAAREAADYGLTDDDGTAGAIIRDAEEVCRIVIEYLGDSAPETAE